MLANPTNRSGSLTSRPLWVKLITRAIAAGINTERAISTSPGARKPQAVAVALPVRGEGSDMQPAVIAPLWEILLDQPVA